MLDKVREILQENTLCVLCTEANGNPYCSLMTYILMDDPNIIYMVATQESKKFKNLSANPSVSVLVDTRQKLGSSAKEEIISITFEGFFQPLEALENQKIEMRLANDHSELNEILKEPNAVVFSIKLKSFLLLDGPINSYKGDL